MRVMSVTLSALPDHDNQKVAKEIISAPCVARSSMQSKRQCSSRLAFPRCRLRGDEVPDVPDLRVIAVHPEPGVKPRAVAEALAAELRSMAQWLGLACVRVSARDRFAALVRGAT
jgi:hypothetical protein